ncbi:MAG: hypothetical protein LC110_14565, partial [Burkholderiales bacterium]|nr:hypothetical protein [Burkholderiales bacterium]
HAVEEQVVDVLRRPVEIGPARDAKTWATKILTQRLTEPRRTAEPDAGPLDLPPPERSRPA